MDTILKLLRTEDFTVIQLKELQERIKSRISKKISIHWRLHYGEHITDFYEKKGSYTGISEMLEDSTFKETSRGSLSVMLGREYSFIDEGMCINEADGSVYFLEIDKETMEITKCSGYSSQNKDVNLKTIDRHMAAYAIFLYSYFSPRSSAVLV